MTDREQRAAAFVDGELAPDARAAFEAEMRADAALAAEVERQTRLRARLSAAYGPVLDEPVPARLTMAASAANDARPRFAARQWAAIAASLVAGVLVGRMALPQAGAIATRDGQLVARGDLARTLDRGLASQAGPIRVGLSFRNAEGEYCRTFRSAPDGLAGVACREAGGWQAQTLVAWGPQAGPDYRTAAADLPPAVLASVDALIAGEPLDAAGEAAARAQGWRAEGR